MPLKKQKPSKAYKRMKKSDPASVVRPGEYKKRKRKSDHSSKPKKKK